MDLRFVGLRVFQGRFRTGLLESQLKLEALLPDSVRATWGFPRTHCDAGHL